MKELLLLVSFLLGNGKTVCLLPFDGDLKLISLLFGENLQTFVSRIITLDRITGKCFETNTIEIRNESRLQWIDYEKLKAFKSLVEDRLGGNTVKTTTGSSSSPPNSIVDAVHADQQQSLLFDIYSVLAKASSARYVWLEELLSRQTAQNTLAASKIKLKLPRKPFSLVCKSKVHIEALLKISNNWTSIQIRDNFLNSIRNKVSNDVFQCVLKKTHFLPIVSNNTDPSLGDCYYLDTCHRMKSCRHLHYFSLNAFASKNTDTELAANQDLQCYAHEYTLGDSLLEYTREVTPPQWIQCDIRKLPFLILGKFAVIISDPAWDIHMSLPYGTCKDTELMSLPMHQLQDEGILLLWVTGRSIETGRKALTNWGYEVSDEIIWVKLNQLRRTIVTGRTGHWINHSKEHLLVGVKGNPPWLNRCLDSNFVVSFTRETLRKPDEIYDIVERIVGKHARKLEMFGRDHNTRPGWITIGNQIEGFSLHEEEIKRKYEAFRSNTNE